MKPKHPVAILCTIISLASISIASAGPPGPPPPRGNGGGGAVPPEARPQPSVTEEELGAVRDKFETYRKLTFEGFRFYVKSDETLRVEHAAIYQKIRGNTLNERLTVTQARGFVLGLLEISRDDAALADKSQTLATHSQSSTAARLYELSKTIDATLVEKIDGEILTPDLNRREWLMDELVHFGADTTLSTTKRSSLVNRLDDLLAAEERTKQSGDLSDTERNKLLENSVETWKVFLRTFKR